MSINEKIRLIRETKGLTQEQVAEKLGVSPSVYGDIERGSTDPKLSKLQKISDIFEVPLSELINLSDKGLLSVSINKQGKHNVYIGSNNAELEKQILMNELKDKEIAMLKNDIEYLKEIISLLKNNQPTK